MRTALPKSKLLAFILILLMSCAPKTLCQISEQYPWKNEIQSLLDKQAEAWNNGNIDGYMEGYWKSDSLLFTSGGNVRRGWQATIEKYKKSYDSKKKMGHLKFSDLRFYQLSTEAAWVFGRWELERTGDHPNGVFTLVLRKFSDGWKIIHDHTSSSPSQK